MKIADDVEQARVAFLCQTPVFKNFCRTTVHHFYWEFERIKYIRGQAVFTEEDPVDCVYIV